jgi:hypothetical protein
MTTKKQSLVALVLLLLIPVVLVAGGALFSFINPEIAARHPNYARNFHLLMMLKVSIMWGTAAVVLVLWVLVCLQLIRSKNRSSAWLVLAALGPFGLAVLAMLNDRVPLVHDANVGTVTSEPAPYTRFVRNMNGFVRFGYELCTFVAVWWLAYEIMVVKRTVMIWYQSAATGLSTAQIIDQQNASGGMWAFAEGLEVMFFVVLLYLLRPVLFNLVVRLTATRTSPNPS